LQPTASQATPQPVEAQAKPQPAAAPRVEPAAHDAEPPKVTKPSRKAERTRRAPKPAATEDDDDEAAKRLGTVTIYRNGRRPQTVEVLEEVIERPGWRLAGPREQVIEEVVERPRRPRRRVYEFGVN
jgi:hypothetical protein